MSSPDRLAETFEDVELDKLITWALRDSVSGHTPSPQVWQNIAAEIRGDRSSSWVRSLSQSLRRAPFSRFAVLSLLLLAFSIGINYNLARRDSVSHCSLISYLWRPRRGVVVQRYEGNAADVLVEVRGSALVAR